MSEVQRDYNRLLLWGTTLAAVGSLALTSCAGAETTTNYGPKKKSVVCVNIPDQAKIYSDPGLGNPHELVNDAIATTTYMVATSLPFAAPEGVREYKDNNGAWRGIDVRDFAKNPAVNRAVRDAIANDSDGIVWLQAAKAKKLPASQCNIDKKDKKK